MEQKTTCLARNDYKSKYGAYPEDHGYFYIADVDDNTIVFGKTNEAIDAFVKAQTKLNKMSNVCAIAMLLVMFPVIAFILEIHTFISLAIALTAIIAVLFWALRTGKQCQVLKKIYTDNITVIKHNEQ